MRMRSTIHLSTQHLFFLLIAPISALQIPPPAINVLPFNEPYIGRSLLDSNGSSIPGEHDLLKRDGNCPVNFNACTRNGYQGACCQVGAVCTTDTARHVACCPTGAACTGTVGGGGGAAAITGAGTTTAGGGGGVFGNPTSNAVSTSPTPTATGGVPVSYVPNTYFPFPYIATSYTNSAACNSAYEACQTNLAACTLNLQGGGFGVTIVAPAGGGVTVSPTAQNLGPASATSICSSLSQQACYGIQSGNCAQFGTGTAGNFVVDGGTSNGGVAARPTAGCFAAAGILAGVGLGIAGQMV